MSTFRKKPAKIEAHVDGWDELGPRSLEKIVLRVQQFGDEGPQSGDVGTICGHTDDEDGVPMWGATFPGHSDLFWMYAEHFVPATEPPKTLIKCRRCACNSFYAKAPKRPNVCVCEHDRGYHSCLH